MRQLPTHRFFAYALILTLVGSLFSLVLPAGQSSYALHENVTINVGDDVTTTYDPEDSIVVSGTIDNVEDDEDVTLKFKNPSGSTAKTQDVEEDEDDGYFDYSYDIPNSAADGVWTVEAEYSGDKMFTYFIVDDEDDTITLELNNDDHIYEAEDEVTISGQVENQDDSEENVVITVLGPDNEPLDGADEEEVALGEGSGVDDDEFEFSFDLDEDAPHGRYAVIVTYDVDDQEGSTLFEIEDPEADSGGSGGSNGGFSGDEDSNGDLSAQIEQDSYEPGDTVAIQGEINDYDEDDNIDLEVVVEDPDGEEVDDYGDSSANVKSSGDFEYEFDLDEDADEGTYTVFITYGNDEIAMEFEVGEGGGDDGGSPGLTVKLNKASYLAGETMTVSGTVNEVADPDEGEELSIFLYDPESRVILAAGASKYVTPSPSGAYSATLTIPSDLDEDEGYKVIVSYLDDQVEVTFDITGVSSTPSDEITVETDRDEYEVGQTLRISGEVGSAVLVDGRMALVFINKPDGGPCRTDQIDIPSSGSFTYSAPLGGNCGVAGKYEVEVSYTGIGDKTVKGKTTFELIGSSESTFDLRVEGKTYPIEYELSGDAINSMFVRPSENKLVVTLNAEDNGQLTLVLPREVIDALEDGEDADFVVTTEDSSGNIGTADFKEIDNTNDERTIVIDYLAGTDRIEIAGTQVVPEFGTIAAIVMAIAIVGTILATAKFGNKFSLFRQ